MAISRVLIIGSEGNMGRRYQAILRQINIPYLRFDLNIKPDKKDVCDGVIIATPTRLHQCYLNRYLSKGYPVLCEKPVIKDLDVLEKFTRKHKNLSMVNQYFFLKNSIRMGKSGVTLYDYFKHGNDGLSWDCIQLFGIARSDVILKDTSPIWTCWLNGVKQDLSNMDLAYVRMISHWVSKENTGLSGEEILTMHLKAQNYEATWKK